MAEKFKVTSKAKRPASDINECFYCHIPIGGFHKHDCALVVKKVLVRAVIEYEIQVPYFWDSCDIEFHRNESSSCADSMIGELEALEGCLCSHVTFEYLSDKGPAMLNE